MFAQPWFCRQIHLIDKTIAHINRKFRFDYKLIFDWDLLFFKYNSKLMSVEKHYNQSQNKPGKSLKIFNSLITNKPKLR